MATTDRTDTEAEDLLAFIAASPTPYHAVAETARRLECAGYRALSEDATWRVAPGDRIYVVRGATDDRGVRGRHRGARARGFHVVGAHTDSPNLRVKPSPEATTRGYHQLGVEVYGGVLLSTWLDRDLSIAGRVLLAASTARPRAVLVDLRAPLLRVPNLAIHLNRDVNTEGLRAERADSTWRR